MPCEGGGSSIVGSCTVLSVSLIFYHTTYMDHIWNNWAHTARDFLRFEISRIF